MREVIVLCEGRTEQEFCRSVVAPSLHPLGISVSGRLAGKPGRKHGGISPWAGYQREIINLGKQRNDWFVGLLVDYYAMPHSWPGRAAAAQKPDGEKGRHVEEAIAEAVRPELGGRFLPCVQLHEFESLLFVSPAVTASSLVVAGETLPVPILERRMAEIVAESGGAVERINDTPTGAPSKRLIRLVPGYDKVLSGVLAAKSIGLGELRSGCPWLDRWLLALESLATP
ncbi:MAG: DUF4276 family protein [Phycisphaeraceae bacterium]|nr:DUF4276 family protein [Phycisphaeraceae bacterium]